jgi:hypothetical protein
MSCYIVNLELNQNKKMKHLLIALTIFLNGAFAQTTKITGMLGIPFGKTKAECIELMKAKGYKVSPSDNSYVTFDNVQYGKWKNANATFYFDKGAFYLGLMIMEPFEEPKALKEYDELISDLSDKYGNPSPTREFEYPYKYGDGDEIIALKGGYATVKDIWLDADSGALKTNINKDLLLSVSYIDINAAERKAGEIKESRLKDY